MNKKCQDLLLDLWAKVNATQSKVKTNRNWVDEYISGLQLANDGDPSVVNIIQIMKSFKSNNIKQAVFANNIRRQLKRVAWVDYSFPQNSLFKRIVTLTSKKKTDVLVGRDAMTVTSIRPVFRALEKKLSTSEKEEYILSVRKDLEILALLDESLDFKRGVPHQEIGKYLFNLRWNDLLPESIVAREINAILTGIMEKRIAKLT